MSLIRPLVNTLFSSVLGTLSGSNPNTGDLALSFVGSATSETATITIPAGAQEGDLAVLFDRNRTTVTGTIPTGWTSIYNNASTNPSVVISYRVLGAGEGGSSVTGSDDFTDRKIMLVFRPASKNITTVTVQSLSNEQTDAQPALDTIPSGSGTPVLLVLAYAGVDAAVPTLSTNNPAMATVATSNELLVGYKVYNSAPQNHEWQQADGGFKNTQGSFYLEIS